VIVAYLGNSNPQMQVERPVIVNDEVVGTERVSVPAPHLNQSVTTVQFADYVDDADFVELTLSTDNDRVLAMIARGLGKDLRLHAVAVSEVEQVMAVHAAGDAPDWVSVPDHPGLEEAIAKHFGCARGEPTALLTNAGRDALHAQHLGTSAQPASFNYVALSASTATASAGSTTLPGEIATASGGLIRAQATYAHTGGTNTSTLTKTFTANGNDSLPVVIAKLGVLNASSVGTLGYETLLNATSTLTISGDNVTVTDTVTAG
jgi:hypothetical protein